ncbi:MAG: 16S rRNA (cytosine(1402)-N(4))-methyltransferase RsmH [Thermodesulfobacteria bacterium]|nr:16S rRNA (cytosine(1402)-N(4))-methyltransferase RsmH [Thermodesulfobacteriota bacterium]
MKPNSNELAKTSTSSTPKCTKSSEVPRHEPVLLEEVLDWLQVSPGKVYVDGTVGLGGHSAAILERSAPDGFLIGFEWNEESFALAKERLAPFSGRFLMVRENFAHLKEVLEELGKVPVDGILVDLGVSSFLLEGSGRGFSFLRDEPLDMRMDNRQNLTAKDLVNQLSPLQLEELIRSFGEERFARRIARAICEARRKSPIRSSKELAEIVLHAVPRGREKKIHPATKTFQALRMAVNQELENLKRFLETAPDVLRPGGRLVVISFHSLEDRLVKHAFRSDERLRVLTKKPVTPSKEEIARNPRARSAKLRVAERI